jgi:hypothetical protein
VCDNIQIIVKEAEYNLFDNLPEEELVSLSAAERKATLNLCVPKLENFTRREVEGRLKNVAEVNAIRATVRKLAGGDDAFFPAKWLLMGITAPIPENYLKGWAEYRAIFPGKESNFHKTARYFWSKRQSNPQNIIK